MYGKPKPRSLVVFDIETVPDTDLCSSLIGEDVSSETEEKKRQLMAQYHLDITDGANDFLRQPFHKIVTLSIIFANIATTPENHEEFSGIQILSLSKPSLTEKEIVSRFFSSIEKNSSRLVSFNGRIFDVPVLKYRAMINGIQSGYFYENDKYSYRYSHEWHCDLIELFSDFGASAKVKLSELCATFKLPGKMGVDGSQVSQLYDNGKYNEIRDYCEIDALNTYLLYIRALHHRGRITTKSYNDCIDSLVLYFNKKGSAHFLKFYEEWSKMNNGIIHIAS